MFSTCAASRGSRLADSKGGHSISKMSQNFTREKGRPLSYLIGRYCLKAYVNHVWSFLFEKSKSTAMLYRLLSLCHGMIICILVVIL